MFSDEKPWPEKQSSAADDATSNDKDEADEDDDDDDDDDSVAETDYTQRRQDADDSDAFDYVRVQLPMGGYGDNMAKSQLTANQVNTTTDSFTHCDIVRCCIN